MPRIAFIVRVALALPQASDRLSHYNPASIDVH